MACPVCFVVQIKNCDGVEISWNAQRMCQTRVSSKTDCAFRRRNLYLFQKTSVLDLWEFVVIKFGIVLVWLEVSDDMHEGHICLVSREKNHYQWHQPKEGVPSASALLEISLKFIRPFFSLSVQVLEGNLNSKPFLHIASASASLYVLPYLNVNETFSSAFLPQQMTKSRHKIWSLDNLEEFCIK